MNDDHEKRGAAASGALVGAPRHGAEAVDTKLLESIFRIEAMDCPTEEALLRKRLAGMPGVVDLSFDLMRRQLTVQHSLSSIDPIIEAVASLGMEAEPAVSGAPSEALAVAPAEPRESWWPLAIAGAAALVSEAAEWFGLATPFLPAALSLAALALAGLGTYRKGWIAIRNLTLNINALMSIAVTGAMLIGQWPEAAMVIVLFALAERIEAASLDRARNAIRGLMAMTPDIATVRQTDGSWQTVVARTVALGSAVRLKPGERVALDGIVSAGHSAVDQSPITGESVPVDKTVGDSLFAGSINQSGELEFTVTAKADESTLARIIHAVESAQGTRAPTQRFVDQFARVYTPVVFAVAFLCALGPPLLLGGDWLAWIYKALVLLVIACPCALVISTPVTIVSGLSAAARRGILIKGGVYLEQGRHMKWLALDKTGTITVGKPALTDFELVSGAERDALTIAVSLASRSDHPVSKAVAESQQARTVTIQAVDAFEALLGRGVKGRIGGRLFHLGNHRLIEELKLCGSALEARLNVLELQGKTAVLVASEQAVLALFGVADTVKESSREAIGQLHALGIKTLMLSGDNQHTAAAIAKQVNIDDAKGNQLPEDKVTAIAAMIGREGLVGMVGDGINDAPALARSDIGFAMGAAGTDTAIETADVAIMDDDLRKIPEFVRLSKATAAVLKQNIALALGVKAIFLGLTVVGMGTMWMAVFADMGTSLIVVLNGLRLLRPQAT
ncbi:MAG: heavy metal translocating P-type ATPase [Thermomonas sp.]|jgi:Cd2+/Zn2+-exporting ATPase|uniref:heavy metal translocating P-type ATPase n=1 Tax=Thermomonas sp. TaxID=1971895 RepID=UPI00261065F8|nr:heavy metal translocating P-type ATPase [Thermomonas sp.]MBV6413493.1 Cadmium-transporting ATPase [Xanthomonadales bacterium]MCC7096881.1 heavy metal translocating P-type ATPase [Thermomonas sp.]MCE7932153.1 heavy metal translocating P-type ATPase [Xanthomonadales bacterium PRO6]